MKVFLVAVAVLGLTTSQASCGQEFRLNGSVSSFTVRDMNDHTLSLSANKGKVTVVMFFSTRCPISNAFNYRRNALYKDYKDRVNFIAVDSNTNESIGEVRVYASEVAFDFPVYKDHDNEVADRFGVQATTEAFVIDASGNMRYRGNIEDAVNPERTTQRGLRQALEEVLKGKSVTLAETKARGCAIRRIKP